MKRYTFEQTLAMDGRLAAVDQMVRTQVLYVRPTDEFCNGCYWEVVVKPLIGQAVGWGRHGGLLRDKQEMEQEVWLCSSSAYDQVTDVWLALLYDADPGNGHGFQRVDEQLP